MESSQQFKMSLVVKKKIANCKVSRRELIDGYKSVGEKLTDENGILSKNYQLLLELDEGLYRAHYEKSKVEAIKKGLSEGEQMLFHEIESYAKNLERKLGVSDMIAEDAQLAILRRKLLEVSQETGKLYMKIVTGKSTKRPSTDADVETKKLKTESKTIQWNYVKSWSQDHIATVFDAVENMSSISSSADNLRDLFLKRHNLSISVRVANYLFIHYGIRRVQTDYKVLQNVLNEAFTKFEESPAAKRLDETKEYVKEKTSYSIGRGIVFCATQFRRILKRAYGSVVEPEGNIEYAERRLKLVEEKGNDNTGDQSRIEMDSDIDDTRVSKLDNSQRRVNISGDITLKEPTPQRESNTKKKNKRANSISKSDDKPHTRVSTDSQKIITAKAPSDEQKSDLVKSIAVKYEGTNNIVDRIVAHFANTDMEIDEGLIKSILKERVLEQVAAKAEKDGKDSDKQLNDLLYHVYISTKSDEYYNEKLYSLQNTFPWTLRVGKSIIATIEFLTDSHPPVTKSLIKFGKGHLFDLLRLTILSNHNINVKENDIADRLSVMLNFDVFNTKESNLISNYLMKDFN